MPLANYGADNPAASDPWPIESTLAPIALGGDQMQAQGMLDSYRLQRQAATNAYEQNLSGQHDFAYQQLAQQLAEARLKALPELLGKPGGAHLLGPGGISGMDMGTDPGVMQGVIGAADRAQAATNLEHAGAGIASTTAAGFQPSAGQASVATGGFSGPQGDPTAIGVAKLKLQGDLARAAASAGNAGPRESMEIPNQYGGKSTLSFPARMSDQQKQGYLAGKGVLPADAPPPNAPLPSGSVAPPPPVTGLQPRQGGKSGSDQSTVPNNAQAGADAARQAVLANIDKLKTINRPAYDDILAGMAKNNGKPDVVMQNGKPVGVRGATKVWQ